ncbi:hypothetical protein BOX15_Mlig010160g8, partial [Macrostomum lignano]
LQPSMAEFFEAVASMCLHDDFELEHFDEEPAEAACSSTASKSGEARHNEQPDPSVLVLDSQCDELDEAGPFPGEEGSLESDAILSIDCLKDLARKEFLCVFIVFLIVNRDIPLATMDIILKSFFAANFVVCSLSMRMVKRVMDRLVMACSHFSLLETCSISTCQRRSSHASQRCCAAPLNYTAHFDVGFQLQIIIESLFQYMVDFSQSQAIKTDVLKNCPIIYDTAQVITIFLHLSTDGCSLYSNSPSSLWPVQAQILNLPPFLRFQPENFLIFSLFLGAKKPNWKTFLEDHLASVFEKTFCFTIRNRPMRFRVKLFSATFDLPALASILNHKQFNGEFGCLYCENPGSTVKVGHGSARKYSEPHLSTPVSNAVYLSRVQLVCLSGEKSLFGIKGDSVLRKYVRIPENILLDSLHFLYENCCGTLMKYMFDGSYRQLSCYLGRSLPFFNDTLKRVSVPKSVTVPFCLELRSSWKAKDYMFAAMYLLPIFAFHCFSRKNQACAIALLSFSLVCHVANSVDCEHYLALLDKVIQHFMSTLGTAFDANVYTINFHLLCHLPEQLLNFGPLTGYSMFSFESQFSTVKNYIQGTRFHVKQICEKLILQKCCTFCLKEGAAAQSNSRIFELLTSKFRILSSSPSACWRFLSAYAIAQNNRLFYATSYPKLPPTQSCIVQLKDGSFCKVVRFLNGTDILADVIFLDVCNLQDFLNLSNVPIAANILCLAKTFLFICRPSSNTCTIPVGCNFLHQCVSVNNIFPDKDLCLVIPDSCRHEYG